MCEENSNAELNKKIQNERIKGKDEFPELMKDRTVQSQEEQFQAGEYYMHIQAQCSEVSAHKVQEHIKKNQKLKINCKGINKLRVKFSTAAKKAK